VAFGLEQIDWTAPWLSAWRPIGHSVASQVLSGTSVADALNATALAPVTFVAQAELPSGTAYEQYIFDTGRVPTRDGLHDFFNGLCWMHFPLAKKKLNLLQAQQIAQTGIQPERGPARDALTVFDENAALLITPDALWDALAAKDWQTVFGSQRALWSQSTLLPFGHALLEKLVCPRKPITAHVFRARAATNVIANVDAWLAGELSTDMLAAKPFAHLPVLGVPGWWPENDDPAFYGDASVFRLPKAMAESP